MAATDSPAEASTPRFTTLLTLAYDGRRFGGIAPQANARTVGDVLVAAIATMTKGAGPLRIVSRTDSGVHARGQLVAFDSDREIGPRGWTLGLNQALPDDVSVVAAARVPRGFDPRDHVRKKTYRYSILRSVVRDPLLEGQAWRVVERLNLSAMEAEARCLVGTHDFEAFRASADSRSDTVRTILRADSIESADDPRLLRLRVEGDRFLYRMVRIIAGTLVDVARGRLAPGAVERAFETKRRADLGVTAPATGLCLERVELDVDVHDPWP